MGEIEVKRAQELVFKIVNIFNSICAIICTKYCI